MNASTFDKRAKAVARRVADRVLSPYFDRQSAEIASLRSELGAGGASPAEFTDFNQLLHTLRTVELQRMARADQVLLSVGCSDRYYFDWIEQGHGPVPEHWGVELYRPEPEDLPANVRWFVASASHMPDVADNSADVLFSGQNIEHLPTEDLVGFLLESRRVLRAGGHLVIDSPNRLITEPAVWRHPEHVIELSPDEAVELITLAGFDVTVCRGYWLCAEADGTVLPLLPEPPEASEFLRRAVLAAENPERSFCWWLEATASERSVDREALSDHVAGLVKRLWDDRVNRGAWSPGARSPEGFSVPAGTSGCVFRAGPFPVFPGTVTATPVGAGLDHLSVRLLADGGAVLASDLGSVHLETEETLFGVWVDVTAERPLGAGVLIESVAIRPVALTGPTD